MNTLPFSDRKPNGEIIHGDALEEMRKLDGESVSVIVTSPPYNMNPQSSGFSSKPEHSTWKGNRLRDGYDCHDDNMTREDYVAWMRECVSEMKRLLSPDGVLFFQHKWRVQNGILDRVADDILEGFPPRHIVIWERPGCVAIDKSLLFDVYELVYVCPKSRSWNPDKEGRMRTVWQLDFAKNNPHPASFPVGIPRRCLRIAQNTSGLVLDPFMGSGTTAIAAEQAGRKWLGIEKSAKYVEMANGRIAEEVRLIV